MAKRFGRPAPSFEDESADANVVRQIRLTREGSGIEGMYDSIAAIDAMHEASTEAARKHAVYDGVLHWIMLAVFWIFVIWLGATFLRNLHH